MFSDRSRKGKYLGAKQSGLMGEIINLKNDIKEIRQQLIKGSIQVGKITEIDKNSGKIRVLNRESQNNNSSPFLYPTAEMLGVLENIRIGLYVIYGFVNKSKETGLYFAVVDPIVFGSNEPPIDLSGYVTEEELTVILEDYITDTALTTVLESYATDSEVTALLANYMLTTTINTKLDWLLNNLTRRYYTNKFVQSSKGGSITFSVQWFNSQITFYCNGSDLPSSGTPVQDGGSNIGISFPLTTVSDNAVTGTRSYIRIATTARIAIVASGGVTLGGVLNGSFLLPVQTQWVIEKTGASTWSLTEIPYSTIPYTIP